MADTNMTFAALARRYCDFVINASELETSDFLEKMAAMLSELYYRATQLNGSSIDDRSIEPTTTTWKSENRLLLAKYLADQDIYWSVFEPYSSPYEDITPDRGSLVDDLDDIAADLARGLWLFEQGLPIEAVAWEWQITFRSHWGTHLVQALSALHTLVYK